MSRRRSFGPSLFPWLACAVAGCSCSAGPGEAPGTDAGSACYVDQMCPAGHCVNGSCVCDPTLCPGRCSTIDPAQCVADGCTTDSGSNRCGAPGFDLCDPAADECFPSNGSCDPQAGVFCPTFGGVTFAWGSVTCNTVDDFCQMAAPPRTVLGDLASAPVLMAGGVPDDGWFPDDASFTLQWPATTGPVVVAVSTSPVTQSSDLQGAIWSAYLPAGVTSVAWSDGATRTGSDWVRPPSPPPHDVPLYAVVASYDGTRLAAVSSVIPFRVGSAWPWVGDACPVDGGLGACESPVAPLVCLEGTCHLLCASDEDCSAQPGQRCLLPDADGVRVCFYSVAPLPEGGGDSDATLTDASASSDATLEGSPGD